VYVCAVVGGVGWRRRYGDERLMQLDVMLIGVNCCIFNGTHTHIHTHTCPHAHAHEHACCRKHSTAYLDELYFLYLLNRKIYLHTHTLFNLNTNFHLDMNMIAISPKSGPFRGLVWTSQIPRGVLDVTKTHFLVKNVFS